MITTLATRRRRRPYTRFMSNSPGFQRAELSVLLRGLRTESGLTTRAAAGLAGFGHSKLSKIEGGTLLPSFADGEALCRVYDASPVQRDQVLDLLRVLHEETESARVILARGTYRKQLQIAQIEAGTTVYRDIQVAMVSGLLQTEAYIEQVMGRVANPADRAKSVAARIERQTVLDDQARTFSFLMTEGALRWHLGSPALMAAQVDHIIATSLRPNVQVGILDWRRPAPPASSAPTHEVHIYDERLVIVGIKSATAHIEDPRDIAIYLGLWEELRPVAVWGDEARALLARIADEYRALNT